MTHLAREPNEAKSADSVVVESHLRSILKALSWRILATTTTFLVAFFWLGKWQAAAAIGSIEFFAKIPVYYLHERCWQLVPRGAIRRLIGRK